MIQEFTILKSILVLALCGLVIFGLGFVALTIFGLELYEFGLWCS